MNTSTRYPLGTSDEKIEEKNWRVQHQPHEAIRATAGVDVFELQHRKLLGKREAWRYSHCLKLLLGASLDRPRCLLACINWPHNG